MENLVKDYAHCAGGAEISDLEEEARAAIREVSAKKRKG